jgi:hypothetical protein
LTIQERTGMPRWVYVLAGLLLLSLFLIANRGAYRGFFQGDDLDNLGWAPTLPAIDFVKGLVTPIFSRNNFRPVGHFYFRLMEMRAGLQFARYVAVLQAIHVLNAVLLVLLLRRMKFRWGAAVAALLFFAFHPATFDAYWQPMYVFDVLCGTFCLLSFLGWVEGRWILSFVAFWLAYKAKEVAVMLPAVFFLYEYAVGGKRWKQLIPFFAVSLLFGIQALIANAGTHDAYTLQMTPGGVGNALLFYGEHLFLNAWPLLMFLPAVYFTRDRRFYFGILATLLLTAPMLALPTRLSPVYLYVPLIGMAVSVASLAEFKPVLAVPVFLMLWLPITYLHMREYRKATLTAADENRTYVNTLAEFVKASPSTNAFIYDGEPGTLHSWGIGGALRYLRKRQDVQIDSIDSPGAAEILRNNDLAVLSWDGLLRKLQITRRDPATPIAAYVSIDRGMPIWQFGDGWFPRENKFRWTRPMAWATLMRPADAKHFSVTANFSPVHIAEAGTVHLKVIANGEEIGSHDFNRGGWQTVEWTVKPGPEGPVRVEFQSDPPYRPKNDPRTLGIALGAFGYLP